MRLLWAVSQGFRETRGGNIREQVVDDVLVNDAVEEVAADEAKVAVDGGEGALDVGPALGVKVGDVGVVVVEVGDGDWGVRVSCFFFGGAKKTYRASGEPTCRAPGTSGTPSASQRTGRRGTDHTR